MHHSSRGFSLVELSIVLVILGLLTGGILAGQSLIRASELRAVSTEYQRYVAAMGTFRDKYFAAPGDMRNAAEFWLIAGTCPGTSASPSSTAATCNGNGDGTITALATGTCGTTSCGNEIFRAWQHLANAGLIEGTYNGVSNNATATTTIASIGTNVPRSKLGQAGWNIGSIGNVDLTSLIYYEGTYGNALLYGAGTAALTPTAVLKAEEAWNIDTKMDDGKPSTGGVVALESQGSVAGATGCGNVAAVNGSTSAALYRLDTTSNNCSLIFKTGY